MCDTLYHKTMSNPNRVTISISGMPAELVAELEAIAKQEHRDRSGQIVKFVEDALRARRSEQQTAQLETAA